MAGLVGKAFAKINLGLHILERRPDGFHELRTIFQTISLADRIAVDYRPAPDARVRLKCSDPALAGDDNLAARAARELLGRLGIGGEVAIDLDKRVPAGAGLGGGSSDAAAVLLALERLIEPVPDATALFETAAALGSDVPFFLLGGRAVGLGRGEEIYPLPDPPKRWLVVVAPRLQVSTAEAYGALAEARGGSLTPNRKRLTISTFCSGIRASESGFPERGSTPLIEAALQNDFEDVIFRRHPELAESKTRLEKAGSAAALLSGSGSALFGLFESREAARAAQGRFDGFDGKTFVAHTVDRRTYRRSWKERDGFDD